MAYLHAMSDAAQDLNAFYQMVETTLERLPEPFGPLAREVGVSVIDLPPRDMLQAMQIDDPMALTGLYEGIPLTEKSHFDQPTGPDLIWLFRLPILQEWQDRRTVPLPELVTHVLVHELAHHFGWSDADIARIDRWWE